MLFPTLPCLIGSNKQPQLRLLPLQPAEPQQRAAHQRRRRGPGAGGQLHRLRRTHPPLLLRRLPVRRTALMHMLVCLLLEVALVALLLSYLSLASLEHIECCAS